jgi:hypothetical protein
MMKNESSTKFFGYAQNNSYGHFDVSEQEGISLCVIIEAQTAKQANDRARSIGLYFDGVEAGIDCPCCGDRWYEVDDSDGTDEPTIYGIPVEQMKTSIFRDACFVHYADGTFKKIELND